MYKGLEFKRECKIDGASNECHLAINIWDGVCRYYDTQCLINSVKDGRHSNGSKHWRGDAFDGDTHDTDPQTGTRYCKFGEPVENVISEFKRRLPKGFDVVYENTNGNEHLHCEYDPKSGEI
ncbi:hypothetical protein [uncultured Paraglaciecola sp.]|uniref:hypothetical protein n=1 Tax=uncultured Paraglaciecola sp. TaxID=1765024 RepID=UPI00260C22EC|nr:hypothetical protein [uncultured Paraglaciecola sp.]